MRVTLAKDRVLEQQQVKVLEAIYNHAASADFIAHLVHRIASVPAQIHALIGSLAKASLLNAQILLTLREKDSSISLVSKDISNLMQKEQKKELGRKTPIQQLLEIRISNSLIFYNL